MQTDSCIAIPTKKAVDYVNMNNDAAIRDWKGKEESELN